jgi:hypothetical protein
MHTLIVAGLVVAGVILYLLLCVFAGRFAGFNKLPSG